MTTQQTITTTNSREDSSAQIDRPIRVSKPMVSSADQPIHDAKSSHSTADHVLETIRTLGRTLDDLEHARVQNNNRIAALEREFGSSLPQLEAPSRLLEQTEHAAELELVRAWRKHPLAPWVKTIKGAGEKSVARLIAEIGDPAERENPQKLWAYCGVGDPARVRVKGMTQDELFKLGNPRAKKQCWLIGEAFVKTTSGPYREVYDEYRERYKDRVHAKVCVRCGPSGKPAQPGSPWSLKHQHEAAKRATVKRFLKDLWIQSRHSDPDTQPQSA